MEMDLRIELGAVVTDALDCTWLEMYILVHSHCAYFIWMDYGSNYLKYWYRLLVVCDALISMRRSGVRWAYGAKNPRAHARTDTLSR